MAPRHRKSARSSRPGASSAEHKALGRAPTWKNATPGEGTSATQPGMETQSKEALREAKRQDLFQKKSNKALDQPNYYLKVAVLIIRWDPKIDDFDGHTEEIKRLQDIFEIDYQYTCKVHEIQDSRKPQADLNGAIYNHILDHDGPHNLLIFYYTGHGFRREGKGLELSANQTFANTSARHVPIAFWESAEEPIIQHMEGDALSILDCCMASTAGMKCRDPSLRAYQLLAASAADAPTCGPGENSFTTALCESLKELLNDANGGTFPLTQLCEKINTKRKHQACLSWDRLRSFKRTVQLGRLEQIVDAEDALRQRTPEQASLLLRLSFKSRDLQDEQIERLAEQFPKVCQDAEVQLLRIDWVRMMAAEREVGQNLGILQTVSHAGDRTNDSLLPVTGDEVLTQRLVDNLYQMATTVRAAQNFRAAVRRKQAERQETPDNPVLAHRSYKFVAAMFLKLIGLLLTVRLLYFRGEQTALVMAGIMIAWMLMYGPCRLPAFQHFQSWYASHDLGSDDGKPPEGCVTTCFEGSA